MTEVVVTGIGAVTPLGLGAATLHERWAAGVCGIENGEGRCREFVATDHLSVKEARRADMSWDKTVKTGKVTIPT